MAHMILMVYGSPEQQKKFVKKVNSMEYDFKGSFKGKTKPFISEVKMYDVRIKKEVAPEFLRDAEAMFTTPKAHKMGKDTDLVGMQESRNTFWLADRVFHWLRKFTPLRGMEKASGPVNPKYQTKGWSYVMFVGSLPDPHTKEGEEIL